MKNNGKFSVDNIVNARSLECDSGNGLDTDDVEDMAPVESEADTERLDGEVKEDYDRSLYATNPVKAIRLKCRDCMSDQTSEIRKCPIPTCPLYPFRFGKNPFYGAREKTPEQIEAMREKLAKARAARQKKA